MTTLPQESGASEAGWGVYQPGEAVLGLDQLRPGDVVLQRVFKSGFPHPSHHVLEVIGGDPSGENRPFVRARLLDPSRGPVQADSSAWVVLWDFCLTEGRAELFRAALS